MAQFSQFTDTQVETLFEDWNAEEPRTKEDTNFGVSTTDLYAKYSYYSKLVSDRAKWEQACSQDVVDFESLLLGESANTVDPESMIKTFHQERLSNGELLRLTQNPVADKNPEEFEEEPSIQEVDELEIPVHVIKRKTVNPNPIDYRKPPPVQSCLPLRIKDVMRIEIDEKQSNSFRHFGSEFRLVTIFGRISRLAKKEKWSQRYGLYTVDDGSGEIVVHYNHLKKESKETFLEIAEVEQVLKLRRNKMSRRIGAISEDIRKILQLSRAQLHLQMNYFNRGDRVLVLGVPFRISPDEVRVFAYEMYANAGADCDFEIYFKELLFNAYCKYFLTK